MRGLGLFLPLAVQLQLKAGGQGGWLQQWE